MLPVMIGLVAMLAAGPSLPDVAVDAALFGLTCPLRLASAACYSDGGTVGFAIVGAAADTLRGGFDGRMRQAGSYCSPHCYVGGDYPTTPEVRPLPLWGLEERALIRLLTTVLGDTLSADQIQTLLSTSSALRLPTGVSVELWHLTGAVEVRRKTQEAIDQGLLMSREATLGYFRVATPLRTDGLVWDHTGKRFALGVRDSLGKSYQVSFPATPDSILGCSSVSWSGGHILWLRAGSWEDRALVTLVLLALGRDDAQAGEPTKIANQVDRKALLDLLRSRTAKVLEIDAKT